MRNPGTAAVQAEGPESGNLERNFQEMIFFMVVKLLTSTVVAVVWQCCA